MIRPSPDLLRSRRLVAWWWLPLLPAAWLSLFSQLGYLPLEDWDEARLAVSAAEMLRSRQWLITTYRGAPDLWNTKPPLLVWLQALSLHLFGYSEWAFRLPSALAALALVAVAAVFARRWLGGPLAGLLTGLALLTSKGFVAYHVARSGDYETLLLLFLMAQVLAVFAWLHTRRGGYLLLAGLAVALAVLTKSVAGLFFVPGLLVETGRRGRLGALLRQPATWVASALALGLPLLWYWQREAAGPGYWQAVYNNELGGRLLESQEQHTGPWYDYLTGFFTQQFLLWTPWVLAAGWALWRRPTQPPAHRFLTLALWTGGLQLLVVSAAQTKLPWYNAPLFPLLALLLGGGLTALVRRVAVAAPPAQARWRSALLLLLAVVPSAIALQQRRAREHSRGYESAELTYGRYLRDPAARPPGAHRLVALHQGATPATAGYNAPLEFYALAFRHDHPQDTLEVRYEATGLAPGQVVLVCGAAAQAAVARHYRTRTRYIADSCRTLQVEGPR